MQSTYHFLWLFLFFLNPPWQNVLWRKASLKAISLMLLNQHHVEYVVLQQASANEGQLLRAVTLLLLLLPFCSALWTKSSPEQLWEGWGGGCSRIQMPERSVSWLCWFISVDCCIVRFTRRENAHGNILDMQWFHAYTTCNTHLASPPWPRHIVEIYKRTFNLYVFSLETYCVTIRTLIFTCLWIF